MDIKKIMAKSKLLLVDLQDTKIKKLAETITSETSRKILSYLAEKDDTEAKISEALSMPISTVHYHLQKLMEAGLVVVDEFHYSKKGREINHYKLANQYIIIAPKKVSGLKQKLKNILPVGLAVLGISTVIKAVKMFSDSASSGARVFAEKAAPEALMADMKEATVAPTNQVTQIVPEIVQQPDVALWFLLGGVATLLVLVVVILVKEWLRRRRVS